MLLLDLFPFGDTFIWVVRIPGTQFPWGFIPQRLGRLLTQKLGPLDPLLSHFSLEGSGGRKFEERVAPLVSSLFSSRPNKYTQLTMSDILGQWSLAFENPAKSVDHICFCAHLPHHACCLEATCISKTLSQISRAIHYQGGVDPHSSS